MVAKQSFRIWEGVYRSFAEAPTNGPGFRGETWLQQSLQKARDGLDRLNAGRPIDRGIQQRNSVLPAVLATLLAGRDRVQVLDFGGGIGFGYLAVAEAVPDMAQVDYHIVEVASICHAGRALFAGEGPVFHEAPPEDDDFDVVCASSALQYIEDWRSFTRAMVAGRPSFVLFSDVFAGHFSAFCSLQNYYESRIPLWFLNLDELVIEVERHGYRLVMKSPCDSIILDGEGPLPMDNFPPSLRLRSTLHLLFRRKGDGGRPAVATEW